MDDVMAATEIVDDLVGPEGRQDPYPRYERLRAYGPVVRTGAGMLVVTGYQEAEEVLRAPGFLVEDGQMRAALDPGFLDHPGEYLLSSSILQRNAPDHGRMRSLIASVFTPRRVAALAPAVTAAVDDLLDDLARRGADGTPVDFLDAFAFRLPVGVICELLGVPVEDRHLFRPLAADLTVTLEFDPDEDERAAADLAAVRLSDYFAELAAARRADPRDDLVSALVRTADAEPDRLSDRELIANLALLLVAGFETTGNLIGNALARLFAHPEAAAALRDGTLDPGALVEEVLRHDPPVQLTSRLAAQDGLTAAGLPVEAGTAVLLLLGAANRDPRRYPDPGRFDPWRYQAADGREPAGRPLSFGSGPHFCLGSQLARLEAATALPALLRRFPDLAPAGPAPRRTRLVLRGYGTLPVTLGPVTPAPVAPAPDGR
ncbi:MULTISPECIES: cytochrome P450 [Kitasatospora]|uniref:Putative cytochrome P450 n=1 Tax=Kitasatospora setae (strain ATCC 33774 / DSM 43861 / JCM 3304 / KCC A-0304 / NBRC 14216 / KM-6054) TaxID=452652 RepID=E4NAA2_KITSK|nr:MULTISPECIES: cytochrome P450 [Kitasatospora]BAJ28133.1 putative cytochrome P450 [Kitasatospora setae KM-6054]